MSGFRGRVRKTYPMGENRALVLQDEYEGDVGVGEQVEVALPSGERARVEVVQLAWGSAFRASSPPLTLIVAGLGEELPEEGAEVIAGQ